MQLLADMKPGFIRFPGGCIVEGRRLALRYDWKKTVGDVSRAEGARQSMERRVRAIGRRRTTSSRSGSGSTSTSSCAEDIGATPLPILNCGMACQFNSSELAALDELDPFVQDALDLIEFANGPVDEPLGQRCARRWATRRRST